MILLLSICFTSSHSQPIQLSLNDLRSERISTGQAKIFCYDTGTKYPAISDFEKIFSEIKFDVRTEHSEFNFHNVRGLSTDDFHAHLEMLFFKLLKIDPELSNHQGIGHDANKFEGFIRDIFAACPTPFSFDKKSCPMTFSAFGESCVAIETGGKPMQIEIFVQQAFNPRYLISFLIGVSLLLLSNMLSKSKFFQYTTGSFIFIIGGIVVISIYLNRWLSNKGSNIGNFLTLVLTGTYIWTLKTNLKMLILNYWEYVLGYIVTMILSGIITIGITRSFESSKHILRISVKWILRLQGVILVYNAFSSPIISIFALSLLCVLYLIGAVMKSFGGKHRKADRFRE